MRKFLLTLFAAVVATLSMAQDYPVVTSVDELNAQPEGTTVLFRDLRTVTVEEDNGWYVSETICLEDGVTEVTGNVYPVPVCFTAVGKLVTGTDYNGEAYREFEVEKVEYVSEFATLGAMMNYASSSSNYDIMLNSKVVKANSGSAIVTHVIDNYVFFYTQVKGYYGMSNVYGLMVCEDTSDTWTYFVGAELVSPEGWRGFFTPTYKEYNDDYDVVAHKGGNFKLASGLYLYAYNWEPYTIAYEATDFESVVEGYVQEAQPVRFAPGGTFVEKDGKIYYEITIQVEKYDYDTWEIYYENVDISIECAAPAYVGLADRVGQKCDEYICGVWDYSNIGNTDRLLINEFLSSETEFYNIGDFLSYYGGSVYEEEIPAVFDTPLTVTYVLDDGSYKFIVMVQDETGALALNFSEALTYDDDGNPEADYAALKNIKPGDQIVGVKGFAQYETAQTAPNLTCAYTDWSADDYPTITFLPEVVSSGNAIKPNMTVTVNDLLNEYRDCQENGTMPKIANNVVRILDAQVLDTLDSWGYEKVKYLIQGTDTMELSNLWDKFGFQTYERNNIVGIADYYIVNSNYIYQLQPLSQENITDASLTPEVSTLDELVANEGTPVIVKNVDVERVAISSYETAYFIFAEVVTYGVELAGQFDLFGMYENGQFTVYDIMAVHSFATIDDINSYVADCDGDATVAYEVTSPAIVTHVVDNNVFIQYDGVGSYGQSLCKGNVLMGVTTAVKQGDLISGIKGISTPCVYYYDENYNPVVESGASFALAADATIEVLSIENEINYGQAYEYAQLGYNLADVQGGAVKITPVGELTAVDGRYYYTEIGFSYDEEWNEIPVEYTIEFISNTVDLATWIDADFSGNSIAGVLDYKNTSDETRFYVHGLVSNTIECENIAEVIEVGEKADYSMILALANNPVVTYVYKSDWSAGLMVQDETGAIFLSFNYASTLDGIKVGDKIAGAQGSASWGYGRSPALFCYDDNTGEDYPVTVVSSDNHVEPVLTTLADLAAEAAIYADWGYSNEWVNRLVKLQGVTYGMTTDSWGDEWPAIFQGEASLLVTRAFAEAFGVTEGQEFDLVGVVDNCRMNPHYIYTVMPRTKEDVAPASVEGIEAENNNIYLDANYNVVAPGAVAVALYDVNGRQVGTTSAAGLAEGVYVVRATYADGAVVAAKVVR